MFYVYVLQSRSYPKELYVGSTNNLRKRFLAHNNGIELSTKRYMPWDLIYYEAYSSEHLARLREKRLKHHGNAMKELKKRIIEPTDRGFYPAPFKSKLNVGFDVLSKTVKSLKKNTKSNGAGFTLIEIITAIGVLTILATVILAAVNPLEQFRKAQDAKRKSDLAQVQRALEAYYQDFGRYPAHTTTGLNTYTINTGLGEDDNSILWGAGWSPYMDIVPVDPSSSKFYIYVSDSTNGYQSYRIYASLDRGTKDPEACIGETGCPNAPGGCGIDEESYCNFGLTSPNVSP